VRIDNTNAVCRCGQVSAGGHAEPARPANAYSCAHNYGLLAPRGREGGRGRGGDGGARNKRARTRDVSVARGRFRSYERRTQPRVIRWTVNGENESAQTRSRIKCRFTQRAFISRERSIRIVSGRSRESLNRVSPIIPKYLRNCAHCVRAVRNRSAVCVRRSHASIRYVFEYRAECKANSEVSRDSRHATRARFNARTPAMHVWE